MFAWILVLQLCLFSSSRKNKEKRNKPCPTYSSLNPLIQRALHGKTVLQKTAFHLLHQDQHQGDTEEPAARAALNTTRNPFFCWVNVLLTCLVPLVLTKPLCFCTLCPVTAFLHAYDESSSLLLILKENKENQNTACIWTRKISTDAK